MAELSKTTQAKRLLRRYTLEAVFVPLLLVAFFSERAKRKAGLQGDEIISVNCHIGTTIISKFTVTNPVTIWPEYITNGVDVRVQLHTNWSKKGLDKPARIW